MAQETCIRPRAGSRPVQIGARQRHRRGPVRAGLGEQRLDQREPPTLEAERKWMGYG